MQAHRDIYGANKTSAAKDEEAALRDTETTEMSEKGQARKDRHGLEIANRCKDGGDWRDTRVFLFLYFGINVVSQRALRC